MMRPNIMWLWTVISFVILGYWAFSGDGHEPVKTDRSTIEQLVENDAVKQIVVVNREEARVVIKESKIDSLRNSKAEYKNIPTQGYQLYLEDIGSVESLEKNLAEIEQRTGRSVDVDFDKEESWQDSWLIGLLPWGVMIGLWFFMYASRNDAALFNAETASSRYQSVVRRSISAGSNST